jgi:hypothetical protein
MMKYYVVLEAKDITQEMIDESMNNTDTFRMSIDNSLAILKFCCHYPNTVGGYVKYEHEDMLQFLEDNKASWVEVEA